MHRPPAPVTPALELGSAASPAERCTGARTPGAIYWECGLVPGGTPVERFLLDPPVPAESALTLQPLGVSALEIGIQDRRPLVHLLDWVSRRQYPNVADFIEETRHFGLSRRMPRTLPWDTITPDSRVYLAHERAYIANPAPYHWPKGETALRCPLGMEGHPRIDEPCAGVWWNDVRDGFDTGDGKRNVEVRLPGLHYRARTAPEQARPLYRAALFATFPLTRLVVIRDPEGTHDATGAMLSTAGLHPVLVDD